MYLANASTRIWEPSFVAIFGELQATRLLLNFFTFYIFLSLPTECVRVSIWFRNISEEFAL